MLHLRLTTISEIIYSQTVLISVYLIAQCLFQGPQLRGVNYTFKDRIGFTKADAVLQRTWDADNKANITVVKGENAVTIVDYFNNETFFVLKDVDKFQFSTVLDVTLNDTENAYVPHERFNEAIHGKGIISADSIATAGAVDRIVLEGDATFNANSIIKEEYTL